MISDPRIDHGKGFDWGKASSDYARYRDIYPEEFYRRILALGLCTKGQDVLDLGTGSGVLPRSLYRHGARFTGSDISTEQIEQARRLSREQSMDINYIVSPAENIMLPDESFDTVTACQCFQYFNQAKLYPNLFRMLRPGGRLAVLFVCWLPGESDIAARSEALVLRYNPSWTGGGFMRSAPDAAAWENDFFAADTSEAFDVDIPFTRESWNGRIKACRGIGASLPEESVAAFEKEHRQMLDRIAPEQFTIPHYATIVVLKVKK